MRLPYKQMNILFNCLFKTLLGACQEILRFNAFGEDAGKAAC
jgi:hypothetical protein